MASVNRHPFNQHHPTIMAIDDYANFDLLILPAGEHAYQARVLNSLAGQGQTTAFTLPFNQEELRRFDWLAGIAHRMLGLVSTPNAPPLTPRQFGERLYASVFAGKVGDCYVRSLDEATRTNRGLRICLRLNDAPELALLPWEYLFAPAPAPGFVALSSSTPIVRFPEIGIQEQPLRVATPLRILAVVSNPQDVHSLDVEREYTRLGQALAGVVQRNLVRLERLAAPTVAALQARLRDRQEGDVHILHFMGHGGFDEQNQTGGLYFANGAGAARFVTAENLAILLRDHRPLRLVFLNACEGARGGRDDFFVGTAQTLMQQGLPAAVAMQFPVGDEAAIALAQEFYQALAQGLPVDACVGEARKAVKVAGNELEWGTPVIFSRAEDTRVIVLDVGQRSPDIAPQPDEGAAALRLPPIVSLTGRQQGALADALVAAFGDKDALSRMVKTALDRNLDAIAGGSTLGAVAFSLVDWAQRSGYLRELVQGAVDSQPRNPQLRAFALALGAQEV